MLCVCVFVHLSPPFNDIIDLFISRISSFENKHTRTRRHNTKYMDKIWNVGWCASQELKGRKWNVMLLSDWVIYMHKEGVWEMNDINDSERASTTATIAIFTKLYATIWTIQQFILWNEEECYIFTIAKINSDNACTCQHVRVCATVCVCVHFSLISLAFDRMNRKPLKILHILFGRNAIE